MTIMRTATITTTMGDAHIRAMPNDYVIVTLTVPNPTSKSRSVSLWEIKFHVRGEQTQIAQFLEGRKADGGAKYRRIFVRGTPWEQTIVQLEEHVLPKINRWIAENEQAFKFAKYKELEHEIGACWHRVNELNATKTRIQKYMERLCDERDSLVAEIGEEELQAAAEGNE